MSNQIMSGSRKFVVGNWKGLVRADCAELFAEVEQLGFSGSSIVDKPGRIVRRIDTGGGTIYYKRIKSSGKSRCGYFIKSLLRQPRALAIWHVSEAMLKAGIGCPVPLLAASSRSFYSFCLEDIVVTAEVPYPRIRELLRDSKETKTRDDILRSAGRGIRNLHEKGFVHGDCIPGNICMDAEGKLFFLDNDRTTPKNGLFASAARFRNLLQFASHVIRVLPSMQLLQHFFDGYRLDQDCAGKLCGVNDGIVMDKVQKRVAEMEEEVGKKFLACELK